MRSLASLLCVFLTSAEAVTLRRLYQWSNDTAQAGPENIAVRSCGSLVITTATEPCLYSLDPHQQSPTPQRIHCFANATATTGIAEVYPDVFAVHVGTTNGLAGVAGSFSVWTIDFNQPQGPSVRKLATNRNAGSLNGMTAVPGQHAILSVDSALGEVWKTDTRTGHYSVVGKNAHFLPNSTYPIGLNGMHIDPVAKNLYFSNTANGTFGSAPFDSATDTFSGFKTIADVDSGKAFDDFAIDWSSSLAYVTEHQNRIVSIDLHTGKKTIVAEGPANDVGPFEPTSAVFGKHDYCTLYVVSNEYISPSTGQKSNGQVFEIELCNN